jgi:hypothetical protein
MSLFRILLFFFTLGSGLFFACVDLTDDDSTGIIEEEQYVRSLCLGLLDFSSQINMHADAESIVASIENFSDLLVMLTPPSELSNWHKEYIRFLENITQGLSASSDVNLIFPDIAKREQFSDLEIEILPCQDANYFAKPNP